MSNTFKLQVNAPVEINSIYEEIVEEEDVAEEAIEEIEKAP